MGRKPNAGTTEKSTPWDLVNVFGYALGVDKAVLSYTTRDTSQYNFNYCEGRKVLRELREACILRRKVMEQAEELQRKAMERGRLVIPTSFRKQTSLHLPKEIAERSSVEALFFAFQDQIYSLKSAFLKELPSWFPYGDLLSAQFTPDWVRDEEDFVSWCKRTLDGLGSQPYMRRWKELSTRALRDDRDLIEELCALYGRDYTSISFPYPRRMSNRRVHLEHLREFCEKNGPVVVELDTENTEAALAIAFLKCIEEDVPGVISQVNVYLDGMENKIWRHLSEFISSEVCVREITRIRSQKSVMDTAIIASIMDVKYSGKARGVLLISSDCDFLVLDSQLPDLPVCYCCTRKQASAATLKYLREKELPAVYLDYVVNNVTAARVEQECVDRHIVAAIAQGLPNLRDFAIPAVKDLCPQSKVAGYTSGVGGLLSKLCLSINPDGTVAVSINEESRK